MAQLLWIPPIIPQGRQCFLVQTAQVQYSCDSRRASAIEVPSVQVLSRAAVQVIKLLILQTTVLWSLNGINSCYGVAVVKLIVICYNTHTESARDLAQLL